MMRGRVRQERKTTSSHCMLSPAVLIFHHKNYLSFAKPRFHSFHNPSDIPQHTTLHSLA